MKNFTKPLNRQSSDWALGRALAHEKSVCAVRARKVELPLLAVAAALLGGRPRPLLPSPSRRHTRVGTVSTICVAQAGQRQGLKVVFVATECGPWSKVGGLADVLAALPPALAARGHEVLTVVPRYAPYEGVEPTGISVPLELPSPFEQPQQPQLGAGEQLPAGACASTGKPHEGQPCDTAAGPADQPGSSGPTAMEGEGVGQEPEGGQAAASGAAGLPQHAELWACHQGGVHRVFVDHPLFASTDIYGGTVGGDKGVYTYLEAGEHPDLELRYSVLCQAALAAPVLLEQQRQQQQAGRGDAGSSEPPPDQGPAQQPIIYVANDWPTALLLLRLQYTVRAAAAAAGGADTGSGGGAASSAALQRLLVQRLGASAAAAYCIHNLAYQGLLSAASFPRLGLAPAALPALCTSADWQGVLHHLDGMRGAGAGSSSPSASAAEPDTRTQQQQPEQQTATEPIPAAAAACEEEIAAASTAEAAGAARSVVSQGAQGAAAPAAAADEDPAAAPAEGGCSSGQLNLMRSALLAADCLVTVSRGYATEVQKEGPMSCGMHDILAARGISGIMNGIDTAEWDPATDPHLPPTGRYTAATVARGKARMKALLQEQLGLEVDPDAPLIGFVGRLTQQKGVDVLLAAAPALLAGATPPAPMRWQAPVPAQATAAQAGVGNARRSSLLDVPSEGAFTSYQDPGVQFVLLGTGDPWMEAALLGLPQSFPGKAAGLTTFSEELAHWIMAASDFVLVPSRFEPCGLVAQAGARYGAVPIVCAVGGLKDFVTPEVGYTLPGFSLEVTAADQRQDVQLLISAVRRAAAEYGSARYLELQQHCMALDVSWDRPAAEWEQLLQRMAASATAAGRAAAASTATDQQAAA
ncbi:hypothetical protein ABPG77_005357 [Micractinium sp. CCAP 211/92]